MNIPATAKNIFQTERLQLATYLHASECLPFLGCESDGTGKVVFLFDDPHGTGPLLELQYEKGATCSAASLFASQKYLRRKIDQTLASELRRNAYHHVR